MLRSALRFFSAKSGSAAGGFAAQSNVEILRGLKSGAVSVDRLETLLNGDHERAIELRRAFYEDLTGASLRDVPFRGYDWASVHGQCCERVVGYVPVPVGVIGPMKIDDKEFLVPMATTEGALIASTNRGAKAITVSGGAQTVVTNAGMTRAPVVRFKDLKGLAAFSKWIRTPEAQKEIQAAFSATSRFGKLLDIKTAYVHRLAYLRFRCDSGDAMGMNMVSKGVQAVIDHMLGKFEDMELVSISGNYCTDKKPAAINWIEGRGKSVIAEVRIPRAVVEDVLKTTIPRIIDVNIQKNFVGSAMAGSIGGFNAHSSNMVTAVYIACGQDPAQNVESSQCLTYMETDPKGEFLHASVTLPCVEVGTIGGGTALAPQANLLRVLGCQGPHPTNPGANSDILARVVAATVLAGELSLNAALSSNDLISAHMKLNRKQVSNTPFSTPK